jgi:hypothetical protein
MRRSKPVPTARRTYPLRYGEVIAVRELDGGGLVADVKFLDGAERTGPGPSSLTGVLAG